MTSFSGIWSALITPFDADNNVNQQVLCDLVDYLLDQNVSGFYLCGSTGEGLLMSLDERKTVTETVLRHVDGRAPVIVHIGTTALVDAIALSHHSSEMGAVAVSSIIPPKFDSMDSVIRYYGALAHANPGLPIISYLINPGFNALPLVQSLLQFDEIAGVKYTGANMNEFHQIVGLGDGRDWTVFSGMDEQSLYATMMGSSGHIGSTINLMPTAYQAIRQHFMAGNYAEAQAIQEQANIVTNMLYSTGNFFGALKFAMHKRGIDCGEARLPTPPLTEAQRQWLLDHVTDDMLAHL